MLSQNVFCDPVVVLLDFRAYHLIQKRYSRGKVFGESKYYFLESALILALGKLWSDKCTHTSDINSVCLVYLCAMVGLVCVYVLIAARESAIFGLVCLGGFR